MSQEAISNRTKIELALVIVVVGAAVMNERRWMAMDADISVIKTQLDAQMDQQWRKSDQASFSQRLALLNPDLKVPELDNSGRYMVVKSAATHRDEE